MVRLRQALSGLLSIAAGYRFTEHWFARFHWDRVITSNNADVDAFHLGFGCRIRD